MASDIIIAGLYVLAWVKGQLEMRCRPMGFHEALRLKRKERSQVWDNERRSKHIPTSSPM